MRVYEFAKLVDVPAKDLVKILNDAGFETKSHMSLLTDKAFAFLDEKYNKKTNEIESSDRSIQNTNKETMPEQFKEPIVPKQTIIPELKKEHSVSDAKAPSRELQTQSIVLEPMTIGDLAQKLGKQANEIILFLLRSNIAAAKNQVVMEDVVQRVAQHYGAAVTRPIHEQPSLENLSQKVVHTEGSNLPERLPVIVVLGHVDHGKTTLLDYIRKTRVAAKEKGGITQHLGAYEASTAHGNLVFIDTPGHEAFPKIRQRGIRVADIAVLVVAADDGIMPQTIEAIKQIKSMHVPIVVAINKIDKVDAQRIEGIKRELVQYDIIPEDWGGSVVVVPISAKTGQSVDHLLEMLVLQAQLMDLRASAEGIARGYVLESKVEKGRGPVATVILQTGSMRIGDSFICGEVSGRISSILDSHGKKLTTVGPVLPVQVAGFDEMPNAGDLFTVVDKHEVRKMKQEALAVRGHTKRLTREGAINIIIKTDTKSSKEALIDAIEKISRKADKGFNIVFAGVGPVSESDVELAYNTSARIVTLHVRPTASAAILAQQRDVMLISHDIIYHLLEQLEAFLQKDIPVKMVKSKIGEAVVRKVFDIKGVGVVAGSYLKEGRFTKDCYIIAYRGRQKLGEGKVSGLQRDKKTVKEVHAGFEFGFVVNGITDWQIDDRAECFIEVPVVK